MGNVIAAHQKPHSITQQHKQLFDDVIACITQHYTIEDTATLKAFINKLWQAWPQSELDDRSAEDHAHCLYGLWLSLKAVNTDVNKPVLQLKVPNVEEEGWACHRTVLHWALPDSPFLVDTLRIALNELGIALHLLASCVITPPQSEKAFAVIYAELGLLTDDESAAFKQRVHATALELQHVVEDYPKLLEKTQTLQTQLQGLGTDEANEAAALLKWLEASNFTYLGYREFSYEAAATAKTGLGLCRKRKSQAQGGAHKGAGNKALMPVHCVGEVCKDILIFTKSATLAKIHRAVYPDCIVIKLFDEQKNCIGEGHLLGFFTYAVIQTAPTTIPWIRQKLKVVNKASGLAKNSYAFRTLRRVVEGFPRDELFQASSEELTETLLGICQINERKKVRLFMRANPYGRFVTAIVYVPRDMYNTRVRIKIEKIISKAINSEAVESTTFFSESVLARAYCVFKLPEGELLNIADEIDVADLQNQINTIATGWQEHLETALIEAKGDKLGLPLFRRYGSVLSVAYQDAYDARAAVGDIELFEQVANSGKIAMHVFKPQGGKDNQLRFKVVNAKTPLALSDIIPILENLGVRVLGENPFALTLDDETYWLHDFSLELLHRHGDVDNAFKKRFSEAFEAAWEGVIDNDAFNRLVLGAGIAWRDVVILRAYAAYFKQTLFPLDSDVIAGALLRHGDISASLVNWFYVRFNPTTQKNDTHGSQPNHDLNHDSSNKMLTDICESLDAVNSLDDDRVFQRFISGFRATLRTNFFQLTGPRACPDSLVLKLSPELMDDIPAPKPKFEIFVYSTRVEGVHLRTSMVARGGLRWSDRLNDYRTEVLGLVKAQAVKNAVIVPSGAKGGFVAKHLHRFTSRQTMQDEGIACYQQFIRGLLSVTDNLIEGETIKPNDVVCIDGDDPYLVVAADKGTATFSDIANKISLEYGHWLGDGFASGGSQGYDHKAMGITAKGAWISVQRHFREKDIDIQNESIRVVGIGDMAGDVFGNGMLLSTKLKLVAAFNHMHIFIDPTPEADSSFAERQRLFSTPGSTWEDYNKKLISKGGAVFSRSAKTITLNDDIKRCFDITASKLTPNEFITAIIKAPVDLIWNGGIGTYVKSSHESHADVGDKASDSLRVNGKELRCKVFGEGGNLGMTQLGRIEFCQAGGACNTDFIDNAAGVDCSDHEVNLKILLQAVIERGDLTEKQRNGLLKEYTEEISRLVLAHNFAQTECLSLAERQVAKRAGEYRKLMSYLEKHAGLNRKLEFLPADHILAKRYDNGDNLTRPELAVLLSYAKVMLKAALAKTQLSRDPTIRAMAFWAFPQGAAERFSDDVLNHRLLNEVVSTQLANDFINNLGITAAYRFLSDTNTPLEEVFIAYVVAREVFDLNTFNQYMAEQCNSMPESRIYDLKTKMVRRIRRGVRWFLRNGDKNKTTQEHIACLKPLLSEVASTIELALAGELKSAWQQRFDDYIKLGLNHHWATIIAMPDNLFAGLGVAAIQQNTHAAPALCAQIFYGLHNLLRVREFAGAVSEMPVHSPWQAMARETLLEDIELQLRHMAEVIVGHFGDIQKPDDILDKIQALIPEAALQQWHSWLNELQQEHHRQEKDQGDISLYHVTLRQLSSVTAAVLNAT